MTEFARIVNPEFKTFPLAALRGSDGMPSLSPEAFAVACWAMSHGDGFVIRVLTIRQAFGFGKEKWMKIGQELRENGMYHVHRYNAGVGVRCRSVFCWGRFVGQSARLLAEQEDDDLDCLVDDGDPVRDLPDDAVSSGTDPELSQQKSRPRKTRDAPVGRKTRPTGRCSSYMVGFPVGLKTRPTENLQCAQVHSLPEEAVFGEIRSAIENCPWSYGYLSDTELVARLFYDFGKPYELGDLFQWKTVFDALPEETLRRLRREEFSIE